MSFVRINIKRGSSFCESNERLHSSSDNLVMMDFRLFFLYRLPNKSRFVRYFYEFLKKYIVNILIILISYKKKKLNLAAGRLNLNIAISGAQL